MTGWLTEGNVRRLLRSYDELVWVAQLLANTVAGTRNVHYKPTDARDYEITFGEDTVYARWYHHGDYDSVNYPLRCLWLGHALPLLGLLVLSPGRRRSLPSRCSSLARATCSGSA